VALAAAREIADLPPHALAVTRGLMRGHIDAVLQRIDAEASHFGELLKSDEARAAFQAFFARKK
jgi:enoyl-CoA hydratase/carnithine racemase